MPDDLPPELSATTLRRFPIAMVLADPSLPDHPIIYVNDAFTKTTGHTKESAIGRNCRFLQSEDTREGDREAIRRALAADEEITLDILNYRADGTWFVNRRMIAPLPSAADQAARYYLGVQMPRVGDLSYADRADALDDQLEELQYRVKNHLSMILAMIWLEAKEAQDAETFAEIFSRRLESSSVLYDEFAQRGGDASEEVALGAYLSWVATAVHGLSGRPGVRMNADVDALPRPRALARLFASLFAGALLLLPPPGALTSEA